MPEPSESSAEPRTKRSSGSGVQREVNDRLFKFIFGNPEHKEWSLQLYNAISGTNYTNIEDIELRTLLDVVYMSMKNDISFIIDTRFIFIEQQSTRCPNMPARFFLYASSAYQRIIQEKQSAIYAETLVGLPTPKCICFYNGAKEEKSRRVLRLSDAFRLGSSGAKEKSKERLTPDIEVKVTMININYGRNKKLLNACEPLKEYAWLCSTIRNYRKSGKNLGDSIDTALSKMPKDFEIHRFLMANKAEVKQMCLTEYNETEVFQAVAEVHEAAGRAKGRAEGEAIGEARKQAEFVLFSLKEGMSIDFIMRATGLSEQEITKLAGNGEQPR